MDEQPQLMDSTNNELNNLITLCKNCHMKKPKGKRNGY